MQPHVSIGELRSNPNSFPPGLESGADLSDALGSPLEVLCLRAICLVQEWQYLNLKKIPLICFKWHRKNLKKNEIIFRGEGRTTSVLHLSLF